MKRSSQLLVASVATLLAAAGAAHAQAPQPAPPQPAPPTVPARCTLRVVHALPGAGPGAGTMDPSLSALKPHLERPPFTSWKTFKLLSEKDAQLLPGASAAYPLPDGKSATVTYTTHAQNAAGKHVVKGVFHVDGPKASHKTSFSLDEGGFFLVAGEKYQAGILIYSLSCRTEQ